MKHMHSLKVEEDGECAQREEECSAFTYDAVHLQRNSLDSGGLVTARLEMSLADLRVCKIVKRYKVRRRRLLQDTR